MTQYLVYAKQKFNVSSEHGGGTLPSYSFTRTCLPLSLLTAPLCLSLSVSLFLLHLINLPLFLSLFIYPKFMYSMHAQIFSRGERENSSAERGG